MTLKFTDETIMLAISRFKHSASQNVVTAEAANALKAIDINDPAIVQAFRDGLTVVMADVLTQLLEDVSPETYAVGWGVLRQGRRNVPKLLGPGNGLREVFLAMLQYRLAGKASAE